MSRKRKPINIELRSEDVQEILSRPPHWMLSWGNALLVLLVVLVFILSYFIKYPNVISADAVIAGKTPPVYIENKVRGRISVIQVANGQEVGKGDIIAEIENPVKLSTIQLLQAFLLEVRSQLDGDNFRFSGQTKRVDSEQLFEGAPDYLRLLSALDKYGTLLNEKTLSQQLESLQLRYQHQLDLKKITLNELKLNEKSQAIANERFQMKTEEFEQGMIAKVDYLNAQAAYNESLKSKEAFDKTLIQTNLQISEIENEIELLKATVIEERNELRQQIAESLNALDNFIIRWQNDYTLKSPVMGKIDYVGRRKINQLVDVSEKLFAVIPANEQYEIEISVPTTEYGKIKIGQLVKLELQNFPSNQFGFLTGEVIEIPALPYEEHYIYKARLKNNFISTTGLTLPHSPEAKARAEVVSQDYRLIERLFSGLSDKLQDLQNLQ